MIGSPPDGNSIDAHRGHGRPRFHRSTGPRLADPLLRLRVALCTLLLLIVVGMMGYHLLLKITLLDSLYMTMITLSTVGYRELGRMTPAAEAFTMTLIVAGVTTGAWALQATFQTLLSEELRGTVTLHRMQRSIDTLQNHYIICGYGRMGRHVAQELRAKGVPHVIVDASEGIARMLAGEGVLYLQGDAREDAVLYKVGIERAAGLITVAPSDADNVFITLTARGLNPKLDIVARSVQLENEEKLLRAGASRVVSPYVIGGQRIAAAVLSPHVIEFLEASLYGQEVNLEWGEVTVSPSCPFLGENVIEAQLRKQYGVVVVGLRRGTAMMAITPDDHVKEGDILIVLGSPGQIHAFARVVGGEAEGARL